jgi:hypothetical protein
MDAITLREIRAPGREELQKDEILFSLKIGKAKQIQKANP